MPVKGISGAPPYLTYIAPLTPKRLHGGYIERLTQCLSALTATLQPLKSANADKRHGKINHLAKKLRLKRSIDQRLCRQLLHSSATRETGGLYYHETPQTKPFPIPPFFHPQCQTNPSAQFRAFNEGRHPPLNDAMLPPNPSPLRRHKTQRENDHCLQPEGGKQFAFRL